MNKADGETQSINAATAKEKKPGSGMFSKGFFFFFFFCFNEWMFSKFLVIRNVIYSYRIFSCWLSMLELYMIVYSHQKPLLDGRESIVRSG